MNKARRNEIANLKLKKRAKIYGVDPKKSHALKSHGKPCSCYVCRDEKFRDKRASNNHPPHERE